MKGSGKKKKPHANKQKQKAKTDDSDVPLTRTLANDVEAADSHAKKANVLCKLLDIPDLSTRGGLKLIHNDFVTFHGRLASAFALYKNNDVIASTVITIYARMFPDKRLKDSLFFYSDVLSNILSLLDRKACQLVALQALCALSHNSSSRLCYELAKKAMRTLLDILDKDPDDWRTTELVLAIIGHCVSCIAGGVTRVSAAVLKPFEVPRLLRTIVALLRNASVSSILFDNALNILVVLSFPCSSEIAAYTPAMNFMFACTRSPDLQTRGVALNGVLRLVGTNSQTDDRYDLKPVDVQMPDHLVDALKEYGSEWEGEHYQMASAARTFLETINQVTQDQDLYAMGLKVADLILKTGLPVADGTIFSVDSRTGRLVDGRGLGLPFNRWLDSLPYCANALRAREEAHVLDKADLLDLKYLIVKGRKHDARALVAKSLERNPKFPFFYYLRSLASESDQTDALRAAKKGLKCINFADHDDDYIYHALLGRACHVAFYSGLQGLQLSQTNAEWDEAIAFIVSAWKDATTFLKVAPPDARHMKDIVYEHLLLEMIMRGCDIGIDFEELSECTAKLSLAEEFATYQGIPIPKTQIRLARETIITQMPAATKEWGDRVIAFAELNDFKSRNETREIKPEKSEDVLTAWLENVHMDGDTTGLRTRMTHSRLHLNNVPLYQCSWCESTSAVLRKCSRCEKTRYCDASCQKRHWAVHRQFCLLRTTTQP
ncbi:hypothetical protein SCHPADRAFT_714765 [Schizopora paradoxa]|uniref:MYND-type domain-containing protein n=1 Tax=Schizopora paradoxa TaxID=27342 RepID=A0A0H2R1V3_9AGAM|nr:hypothetical protein SCHPADRAFT_714765 [Schizopora paradoxa]